MPYENTIILALNGSVVADASAIIRPYLDADLRVLAVVAPTEDDERNALMRANKLPAITDIHVQAWVRTEPARQVAQTVQDECIAHAIEVVDWATNGIVPVVRGPALDAEGRSINVRAIEDAWRESRLIVVPAGAALTEDRRPAILGDGSAITTALFIGQRLGFPVRAVRSGATLQPWDHAWAIGYDQALDLALTSTDRRAVLFARRHNVPFEVASPSGRRALVGPSLNPNGLLASDQPLVMSRVGRGTILPFPKYATSPSRQERAGRASPISA